MQEEVQRRIELPNCVSCKDKVEPYPEREEQVVHVVENEHEYGKLEEILYEDHYDIMCLPSC